MSKEVNNNRISFNRELVKKQIIDCFVLFITIAIVFYVVHFLEFSGYELGITLGVLYLVTFLAFEFSKNSIKNKIENVITTTSDKTITDINLIQNKNFAQKEKNAVSSSRIKNVQELVENLQKFSFDMKELITKTQEKTDESLNFTNNEYGAVKSNIQSISSTVGLVEDIAEQTNLLALNAAVEAARAGEHGKGFAVVASEIRKLADESKQATTKIISLINDIQQTANSTVLATEEGTKEIESGLELAHLISENIEQLIGAMSEISMNMKEIIFSSNQINQDSVSTDGYVKEISQMVEENRKINIENETIFEQIETTSNDLKQSI